MSISAIIITKDAADRISRTLKSLDFANEIIVVVDDNTTDNTAEIAKGCGAKVFMKAWSGYGSQKNFALEQATSDWVLFIDDDEIVTTSLRNSIQQVVNPTSYPPSPKATEGHSKLQATSYTIYWLRLITVFLGKPLRHLYGHNPRLFRRNTALWSDESVHEQLVETDGTRITLGDPKYGLITEAILHYSHPTIASYLKKMHRYTTLDAQQMAKTEKHRSGRSVSRSRALPYVLFTRQLCKLLFYRRGILDGWQGVVWCTLSAYYEWEMARKYLQYVKSH